MDEEKLIINVADLVDINDLHGRTFREINREKEHKLPIGTLVEIKYDGPDDDDSHRSVRLYIVHQSRDCDQTPGYYLSYDKHDTKQRMKGWANDGWVGLFVDDDLIPINLDES